MNEVSDGIRRPVGSLTLEIRLAQRRVKPTFGFQASDVDGVDIVRTITSGSQIRTLDEGVQIHDVSGARHLAEYLQNNLSKLSRLG